MIKRFIAEKDTSIVNAFKPDLLIRATGSNQGFSDSLEIFNIAKQASSGSLELSRILIQFPIDDIINDINIGIIPSSAEYHLRMYNAVHPYTVPRGYTMAIQAISRSWDEGTGLSMEDYSDDGFANWIYASDGVAWTTEGGDYSGSVYTASFDEGDEDLSVDITSLVREWISGSANYGVGVHLSGTFETALTSSYTKKFYARGSQYYYKRPIIEARWDASILDDRGSFYASSSLASAADNLNKIYLYNVIRGQLSNIPSIGTGSIYVKLYTSESGGTALSDIITGSYETTGIYSAELALDTTASIAYDRWYNLGSSICFHTGTIDINSFNSSEYNPNSAYITQIVNLKNEPYQREENPRFRLFVRQKDWQPTIYTVAISTPETEVIESAYYRIFREDDNCEVVGYGTGSVEYTKLSRDSSGNYFDFDMSLLEGGYSYLLMFMYYINGEYREQSEVFRFRVEE